MKNISDIKLNGVLFPDIVYNTQIPKNVKFLIFNIHTINSDIIEFYKKLNYRYKNSIAPKVVSLEIMTFNYKTRFLNFDNHHVLFKECTFQHRITFLRIEADFHFSNYFTL